MNPRRHPVCTALLSFAFFASFAGEIPATAAEPATLQPVPLAIQETADGRFKGIQPGTNGETFLAVVSKEWPAGLIPIYVVDKPDGPELRRFPTKGLEGSSEPAFFALPPKDEPDAAAISGRWEARATRGDGSKPFVSFEISATRGSVTGRFDQNTDYRFAYITGGTFQTNRLTLAIEYIRDHFEMTAELSDGRLNGRWRNLDDSEGGTWEATRPDQFRPPPPDFGTANFVERREAGGPRKWYVETGPSVRYGTAPVAILCRVWKRK